eukprot:GFUD01021392.1.p1 GENE.GFUD01021392.1~~GFUD01021392.1.p1  ORF type:complete len:275 (+),score=94.02 GFUD01021392.1:188-1012(+)
MRRCVVLVCLAIITGVSSSQHNGGENPNTIDEDIFKILQDDEDYEELKEVEEEAEESPCDSIHCPAGKECVEEEGEGACVCVRDCPEEYDTRRHVCSNHNQTFQSDCSLYQARCWCEEGEGRCGQERIRHAHIEYYGECRQIQECSEDDMADFPRRMREWMFNVMKELAERDEISPHYKQLEKEAESDQSRRWSNAAVWQWCDLDKHPRDNAISRHELFPLKAPLHSLEHCLAPFLDTCDGDTDHMVTLEEWAKCLELELEELLDKCEGIQNMP